MGRYIKDPISSLTHLAGLLLSVAGLVLLLVRSVAHAKMRLVVACSIFGASLILLYAASTLYHWLRVSERATRVLKRLDHTMIFVLIAGTYTPFCLGPLQGPWGWSLLAAIWTLALAGAIFKLFWLHAPRWLSTGLYVAMGWLVVIAARPLLQHMPTGGLLWLAAGGLAYTVGAVVYATRWPDPLPRVFGFHELWHLFVLAGSFAQYWSVFRYVVRAG